jgi:hypothetical protein
MRTTVTRSLLAVLLVLGAWGTTALGSSSPLTSAGAPGPVYVDSVDIRYLESFPVQVQLEVRGSLPTPCHEAIFEVQDLGDVIDVRLWSLADADAICIQVLEPFEIVIPLGSYETADIPVALNGEVVGRVQVGAGSVGEDPALVGAGWSFGMCIGYCLADLVLEGDRVVLSGGDNMADTLLFVNEGTLTPEARSRIAAALEALGDAPLEPSYGCPDCADGGAAYLALTRAGTTTRHQMEFDDPPAELAELYDLSRSIIGALETCQGDDLVTVGAECQPAEVATS